MRALKLILKELDWKEFHPSCSCMQNLRAIILRVTDLKGNISRVELLEITLVCQK
jgi:hypothetical protein